ncbi:hypothetical protein N7470_005196 [Penicillium chermesinum]|nr:hypothetical protein N7470_005196 [Penicillium chermesinum]
MLHLAIHDPACAEEKPTSAPPPRPKKRVVTPARREQNKAAQKAWRERHKAARQNAAKQRGARQLAPRPSEPSSNGSTSQLEASAGANSDELNSASPGNANIIPLADPLMNNLSTSRDTIWRAVSTNAVILGFDLLQLVDCRANYISPFFRSIRPADRPQDLVASALNTSIPLHLQPTMAQILISHHASLDLIPIPLLRERVIMMCFAHPEKYNLWDLKLDIYARHAAFCKYEEPDGRYQPWDSKRWKIQSWFLEKWKLKSHGALPDSIDIAPVEEPS